MKETFKGISFYKWCEKNEYTATKISDRMDGSDYHMKARLRAANGTSFYVNVTYHGKTEIWTVIRDENNRNKK